jgi:serine phosphatase RsbU (regulator of sigma subunit)/putative methionine-R-sulfoxide reductase with GAF domain
LELEDTQAQACLICETICELCQGEAKLWFSRPVYPLPGEINPDLLPDSPAPDIVQRARLQQKILCILASDEVVEFQHDLFEQPSTRDSIHSISIPLFSRSNLLAILEYHTLDSRPLGRQEVDLLEGLTSSAALALDVARQEKIKNWRYSQLALVRQVSAQITALHHMAEMCEHVTELIRKAFGYYFVAIYTYESEINSLRFRAAAHALEDERQPGEILVPLGQGILGHVAATRKQLIVPDVLVEPLFNSSVYLPETLSEACFPLIIDEKILGILDVQSDLLDAFHEVDVLVLDTLADSIAVAVQSTNLYNEQRIRAAQISSVFEISHALNSILDHEQLLEEIVSLIQKRFGYPHVHIFSVHPGRRLVVYQTGSGQRSRAMSDRTISYSLDSEQGLLPWVARTGKTYLANDVVHDPLYIPAELPPYDTRAELAIPLKIGDEVIGILDIHSADTNTFTQNDKTLFEALASTIAVAYRNASLYRAEKWRRQVAEDFRDVASQITTTPDLNQLLDSILARLETNLPCDAAAIWLMPGDTTERRPLRLAAVRGAASAQLAKVIEQTPEIFSQLEGMMDEEIPYVRSSTDRIGPLGTALGYDGDYSSIIAPLRAGSNPLGLLVLVHHTSGRYGSEAQSMTATFASYAAVAILNARLVSESQQQAWVSSMLLQVAEASQTTLALEDLLSTMLRLTRLLTGVRKCAFFLREEGYQRFELKAWHGFDMLEGDSLWIPETNPALKRLETTHHPMYLASAKNDLALPQLDQTGINSAVILLPLLVRAELTGAYLVTLDGEKNSSPADIESNTFSVLQGIAHQTSVMVENLRLIEAHRQEAYTTSALLQVAQAVVSAGELDGVLQNIVDLLPILVGNDICVIYLWDPIAGLLRSSQVYATDSRAARFLLEHDFKPEEHNLMNAVMRSGTIYIAQAEEPQVTLQQWPFLDVKPLNSLVESQILPTGTWLLGFPLTIQEQVLGMLLVREPGVTPAFWEQRLEIITGIAQQTSLAIQNDLLKREMVHNERIEREIQLARQIQKSFLPDRLPQPEGWEVDIRWEPARQVGGDFYDVFLLDSNRLGLVISDVSDKGLPAALYMTVTRTLIRSKVRDHNDPASVLRDVNTLLFSESPESMFITAVYAILHLDTGELIYANAGHNLPLHFHASNETIQLLPKGGMALGVLPSIELINHTIPLQVGDGLIFYTDGASDTISPLGEAFSEARLHDLISANCCGSAGVLLEKVDQALAEWRQEVPPVDDITLIALRRVE